MSVNWRQSEICIVVKHLSCDGLLRYKFITQLAGERIFQIHSVLGCAVCFRYCMEFLLHLLTLLITCHYLGVLGICDNDDVSCSKMLYEFNRLSCSIHLLHFVLSK